MKTFFLCDILSCQITLGFSHEANGNAKKYTYKIAERSVVAPTETGILISAKR
ncbi:hypothetical protein K9M41_01685 [Candidatus Gracilibacteria bacterium]|nr:hypothetical protein [Candidatus Gracilibacteria bacterium]